MQTDGVTSTQEPEFKKMSFWMSIWIHSFTKVSGEADILPNKLYRAVCKPVESLDLETL